MITRTIFLHLGAACLIFSAGTAFSAPTALAAQVTATGAEQPNVQQALSPTARAVEDAVRAAHGTDSEIFAAYAARGFEPFWLSSDGTPGPKAQALIGTLVKAGEHALPAERYGAARLIEGLRAASPAYDLKLSVAFVRYATDVNSGALTPRKVDRELHVFPKRPAPATLLEGAAAASDIDSYLAGLAPQDPAYQRLFEHYAAFRSLDADAWGEPVAKGRTLRPGDRNARVAQVRDRLAAMGDLDPTAYDRLVQQPADSVQIATNEVASDAAPETFDAMLFDDVLVAALQSFQERHGLNPDGVVGPATLRQLNQTPETRTEQIAVNLERMRWMNRDLGDRHILVNIAGFTMAIINNGVPEFTSRVIVGKANKDRTTEFSDTMTHMVVNPSWYVPTSIAQQELLPKLEEQPDYLEKRGIRELPSGRLVQKPGPGNALGTVKFMFPNQFSIYLHDTPTKRLFQRDVRAFSHGCVRVQRPHELAAELLKGQSDDPAGYFASVLNRGKEHQINLDNPLPVHLSYRTAWVDADGTDQFRGDIYGRDRKVIAALAEAGVRFR